MHTSTRKISVIYIDYNFVDSRYPNSLADGDRHYTYGFGSSHGRWFKKYNPDVNVECWKADSRDKTISIRDIEGVKHIIFPSLSFSRFGNYSASLLRHLKKTLKQGEITIFNVSSIKHLLFYSVALKLRDHPLVVQHHGETTVVYKYLNAKGIKKFRYWFLLPLERKTLQMIDLFFVLDLALKEYMPANLDTITYKVRPTGINPDIFFEIDKRSAKENLGLDTTKKFILYVGRLNLTKHPDLLMEVVADIRQTRPEVELILAGHEKSDPYYNMAVKSGALLYGKILQTELYKYLAAADVYVLAKLDESIPFGGIGELSVQALYCGTPIAGSTVKCFPAETREQVGIVANDHASLKNALLHILDNPGDYTGLREKAMKYYSWENIAKATMNDYRECIDKYYGNDGQTDQAS
jgi:glycosyltransferase involved in cell wall biosynthesis